MIVYPIVVFLHIVGALGLFIGLGIEWLSVGRLRAVATKEEAIEWTGRLLGLRRLLGPSMGVILVTGIFMLVTVWGHVWWAAVGLVGMFLMGFVDGVVARGTARSAALAVRSGDALTPAVRAQLRSERLRISIELRLAVALGIVFLMVVKPGLAGSLLAMGAALVLGVAVRAPAWRRSAAALDATAV